MRAAEGSASLGAGTLNKSGVGDAVRVTCVLDTNAGERAALHHEARRHTSHRHTHITTIDVPGPPTHTPHTPPRACILLVHLPPPHTPLFITTWGRWIQNAAVHAVAHEEQNVGLFDAPHRRGQEEGPG